MKRSGMYGTGRNGNRASRRHAKHHPKVVSAAHWKFGKSVGVRQRGGS